MTRVIGATKEHTRNKAFLASGQATNLLCGADILLTGLYQDLKGEATCPVCEKNIIIIVRDKQVISIVPQSSVLHYVVENPSILSICCDATLIFDEEKCLNSWLKSYNGKPGRVSSLMNFMKEAITRRKQPGQEISF